MSRQDDNIKAMKPFLNQGGIDGMLKQLENVMSNKIFLMKEALTSTDNVHKRIIEFKMVN